MGFWGNPVCWLNMLTTLKYCANLTLLGMMAFISLILWQIFLYAIIYFFLSKELYAAIYIIITRLFIFVSFDVSLSVCMSHCVFACLTVCLHALWDCWVDSYCIWWSHASDSRISPCLYFITLSKMSRSPQMLKFVLGWCHQLQTLSVIEWD